VSKTLFEQFHALFEGRVDVCGTEEGGCDRSMAIDHWGGHFLGGTPMGVYPMVPLQHPDEPTEWLVKWGCVDLDVKREGKRRYDYDTEDEAHLAARNLHSVLQHAGVTSWTEVTRSHGRHVWVFMDDWVPAATMRRALLVACDVADVPPTEVNPKSEGFDDPETLGNYVRLPYPYGIDDNRYMLTVKSEVRIARDAFIIRAYETRNSAGELEALAELWTPPPTRVHVAEYGQYDGKLNDEITPYIRAVLKQGPINGEDRSGWLYWLAGKCREENLTPELAYAVVHEADTVYTHKYVIRKDGDRRIMELIEKQYA